MGEQLPLLLSKEPTEAVEPVRALAPGVVLLRGFALASAPELVAALARVAEAAPFRHMETRGGRRMSVAMTNTGTFGWVSDPSGYRYDRVDPGSGRPWPAIPDSFRALASRAAEAAGFPGFSPDACLVGRYAPGTRLGLHRDEDEGDLAAPIVSVSLGLPAVFLLGTLTRRDRPERVPVAHGDVVIWGGPARLRYHGVAPLREGTHPLLGSWRINLSFRKVV